MKKVATFAFAALSLPALVVGGNAASIRGTCLLRVDKKTYIDGPCRIDLEGKGAFTISTVSGKEYFASVFEPDGNVAEGNWTGTGRGNIAERFDEPLKRKGACWENTSAKVCASRI